MAAKEIDTGTTDLLASLDEGVLTLTMNRPAARNAMSGAMTGAMAQQLGAAELDAAVKCIVLTGAGKGFCAGGDVKGMAAGGRARYCSVLAAVELVSAAQPPLLESHLGRCGEDVTQRR